MALAKDNALQPTACLPKLGPIEALVHQAGCSLLASMLHFPMHSVEHIAFAFYSKRIQALRKATFNQSQGSRYDA